MRVPTSSHAPLFLLGAGFSKAYSDHMPVLSELSDVVLSNCPRTRSSKIYERLGQDVEALITYLHQNMPWKTPEEAYRDKASFHRVTRKIAMGITEAEHRALADGPPGWFEFFVDFLHRHRCTVVTLNYDTLLDHSLAAIPVTDELSGSTEQPIWYDSVYQLPIADILSRTALPTSNILRGTARLLKLHGSVNWLTSADEEVAGRQVYYKPRRAHVDRMDLINEKDLVPLIIPPVTEKSPFYRTALVRCMWSEFRRTLREARELYCVGYSLPKTDLTIRMFLSGVERPNLRKVYLVNNARNDDKGAWRDILEASYREVFGDCLDTRYLGHPDAVNRMVSDLTM